MRFARAPIMSAVRRFFLFVACLTAGSVASAADLSQIPRTIAREPPYRTKPKYCLLVLGPETKTRIWLVQDGDTLYVDRNGNADLTEPGKKVAAEKHGSDDRNYTFTAGELREGGKRHLNLSVGVSDLNYNVGLEVEVPGFQGLGAGGRLVQGANSDANGVLRFADRPQDAPIVHFGGPWTMGLYRPTMLWLDRSNNVDLVFGTPGLGVGTFAHVGYEGVVPDNLAPRIDITFPSRKAGESPLIAGYELKDRC